MAYIDADILEIYTGIKKWTRNKKWILPRLVFLYPSFFLISCSYFRASLPYFTTHTDLVKRQQEAIKQRKAIKQGLQSDRDWTGDGFVKESESMASNWSSPFNLNLFYTLFTDKKCSSWIMKWVSYLWLLIIYEYFFLALLYFALDSFGLQCVIDLKLI